MVEKYLPERPVAQVDFGLVHVGFLHALGRQVGQGYLFSKPIESAEFVKLLTRARGLFLAADRA